MPDDLDDEFGQPAKAGDLDPTHLVAVASRIGTLDGNIKALRDEGHARDGKIANLGSKIEQVDDKVEEVKVITTETRIDLDGLIKQQLNEADRAVQRDLLDDKVFRRKFGKAILRYAGYASAIAFFAYTFGDNFRQFLGWLGKLVGK